MRTVAIASDTRGRVPFAVVGVLLLVSSLVLATTLSPEPAPSETDVERALREVSAASTTAVRGGVAAGSRRAAADPVVDPADTAVGDALNDSQPFRDALRLRIYLQTRDRLERLAGHSDGVRATASLPAVTTTEGYERAIEQVTIERAGANNTSIQTTVHNITVTAHRGDEVVTRRNVTRTVVVPTPVLYVHERMQTYETRLNNSLASPGVSQRLTARLYPIAWARGYAQYGGAPIENVVANRHVSIATNGALLGVQRSVFGRSDVEGRQALTEATALTGITDVVSASGASGPASQVLDRSGYQPVGQNITTGADSAAPRPNESMRIGINETAEAAFESVASRWALNETAEQAYTVDVRAVTDSESIEGGRPNRPDPPGENWTVHSEFTTSTATAMDTVDGRPDVPAGWHTLDRFGRTVEVEYRREATWSNPNPTGPMQTTVATSTERFEVRVALVGNHTNDSVAPARGIETAHNSSASPLDGPNLADVEAAAETELLDNESHDSVAEAVARGEFDEATATITGDRPDGLYTWLYEDLRTLRETVADINTTVERGAVGTFESNPPEQLQQLLSERRAGLVGVPETYDSTAQRARIAARIAYVDAVSERLGNQSEGRETVEANLSSRLSDITGGSVTELRRGLTASETEVPRSTPAPTGPAGTVETRINAQPQYLTLASVDSSQVPALNDSEHPLVARNVNVFSVPYGNAASTVLNGVSGSASRVSLDAAARTLSAANATNLTTANMTLETDRAELQDVVGEANDHVRTALVNRVEAETGANTTESEAIVDEGLNGWATTADRGMALANNSAAGAVATVAAERRNLSTVEEDWLYIRLRRTTTTSLTASSARPGTDVVNRTASTVRTVARDELQSAIEDRAQSEIRDIAQRRLGTRVLPSGLPLAPPLTPWYATMNVWWVTVEGEYARFSVSARHGTPGTPGASLTYAREDEQVTLDADDDGQAETLGSNSRLSFSVDTGVIVVVPPQPRGVGDKDGNSVETSAGWPDAG